MPVVSCPSCAAALMLGDDLYGKSVKCPKCANVFVVPSPTTIALPPPSASPTLAPKTFPVDDESPRPSRRERPRDDDEPSGGRRRGRDIDDDRDFDVVARPRWDTARSGVRVAMIGAAIIFPVFLCVCLTMTILLAVAGPGVGGFGPGPRVGNDLAAGMIFLNCGFVVLLFIAAIVHLIGQIMCCWSPKPYHEKAVRFIIAFGVSIAIALAMFCVWFAMNVSARARMDESGTILGLASLFVVGTVSVAAQSFWFAYMSGVAARFEDLSLSRQSGAILVVNVMYFLVFFIGSFLMTTIRPMQDYKSYFDNVSMWSGAAIYGWYLVAIVRLNSLLAKAVEHG